MINTASDHPKRGEIKSTDVDPSPATPTVVPDEGLNLPWWLKAGAVVFAVIVVGATAFAYLQPIKVLPRIRPAPGYAFTDQDGASFTSETVRGGVTVYSFAPTDCTTCESIETTMAEVRQGLAASEKLQGVDVRLVTIALDDPTGRQLSRAATRSGADGTTWRWVTGSDEGVKNVVGLGFRRWYETAPDGTVEFDPGFVITDGLGVIRGEYRYQTLAADSDKLLSHLEVLADEIRYSKGATAVAYEAAHLFLCYP